MKVTLTCEHGTLTVEVEEGREGIGNVHSLAGQRSFASDFIAAVIPRCPYCDAKYTHTPFPFGQVSGGSLP